jgi:glycosyltransferase involved in cell wall biosynthesis
MAPAARSGLRVVVVGVNLDPRGREPDALLGGTWPAFGRAAAAAQRAGVRVTLVQAAWSDAERTVEGVTCHFIREDGDPFVTLPGGPRIRRRPRRLLAQVRALEPDLVHFEGLLFPRELRALARTLPGVPILAQDHATKCPRGWRRHWYRWGFAKLAGVAFTARAQAAPFVAAKVVRRDIPVFEVIEISTGFVPGDPEAARSVTGLAGDPCLLWAGNLDPNKDPLAALDAVALAADPLPGLRLHMCFRHAPLLERVRARVAGDRALRERVRLVGEVPHARMEAYYRAADFLIQASHAEGSSGAAIEALACGTTPIVTDIPSLRRITGDGACGALVPVGDAGALARAIVDWSGRDRATLRQRARAHFERELSFDAIGRQLRAAYDAVLARR